MTFSSKAYYSSLPPVAPALTAITTSLTTGTTAIVIHHCHRDYHFVNCHNYYDLVPQYLSHLSNSYWLFYSQESYEEKQVPSTPSVSLPIALINKKVENLESAADIPERPSPVSVLEPLFPEDDISPTKPISQSGMHSF